MLNKKIHTASFIHKYETAPYLFLLNQNLTCNFLVISLFLTDPKSRTILGSDQANSFKNTEINKQSNVKFWFNRKKIWSGLIFI